MAFARPDLAQRYGEALESFPDARLIHTDWGAGYASGPDLLQAIAGGRAVDVTAGLRVPTSSIAIRCACAGLGAGLAPYSMVRELLARGDLRRLHSSEPLLGQPYSVAFRPAIAERLLTRTLLEALVWE